MLLRRGGLGAGLEVGRILDAHRRIGLERTLEIEALGDLADRRKDLLADQFYAGERVFLADATVVAPQRQDARPRFLEDALQLGDHRLGRAGDDAEVGHLLFEAGLAARILCAARGELDEGPAGRGGAVARRGAPDGVRKARELALHSAELPGVLDRL